MFAWQGTNLNVPRFWILIVPLLISCVVNSGAVVTVKFFVSRTPPPCCPIVADGVVVPVADGVAVVVDVICRLFGHTDPASGIVIPVGWGSAFVEPRSHACRGGCCI